MNGNSAEIEQPKDETLISIGQEFPLFGPESVVPVRTIKEGKISKFTLNINNRLHIPLDVGFYRQPTNAGYCIGFTPFEPELGYRTSPEDYDPKTRRAKVKRTFKQIQHVNYSDPPFNLLLLAVDSSPKDLNEMGINEVSLPAEAIRYIRKKQNLVKKLVTSMQDIAGLKKGDTYSREHFYLTTYRFPQETLDIVKRLTLLLSFPTGESFAAQSEETDKDGVLDGGIGFITFYPSDQGPFPKIDRDDDMYPYKGGFIFLPTDPKELSQIGAKFVLAEGQPHVA